MSIINNSPSRIPLDPTTRTVFQNLVQVSTRRLLESALKFMVHDKREDLALGDLTCALGYLGLQDMISLVPEYPLAPGYSQPPSEEAGSPAGIHRNLNNYNNSSNNNNKNRPPNIGRNAPNSESTIISNPNTNQTMICDVQAFVQAELSQLRLEDKLVKRVSTLEGRWIYLNQRVPRSEKNINITSQKETRQALKRSKKHKAIQEEEDASNRELYITCDRPLQMLTKQEQQLFRLLTQQIKPLSHPYRQPSKGYAHLELPNTNLNNLFPFLLPYILGNLQNDQSVYLLLKLLSENKYVPAMIETYLHQILSVLINYNGLYIWETALALGYFVLRWHEKYPILLKFVSSDPGLVLLNHSHYSWRIKKLALMVIMDLPLQIDTHNLARDVEKNTYHAPLFASLLGTCRRKLHLMLPGSPPVSRHHSGYKPRNSAASANTAASSPQKNPRQPPPLNHATKNKQHCDFGEVLTQGLMGVDPNDYYFSLTL